MISVIYINLAEKLYELKDDELGLKKYIKENLNLEKFDENVTNEMVGMLKLEGSRDFVIGKIAGFLAMA